MSRLREEKAQEFKELRADASVVELENMYKVIERARQLGFFGAEYHAKDAIKEIKSYLWDQYTEAEQEKLDALAKLKENQEDINDLPF